MLALDVAFGQEVIRCRFNKIPLEQRIDKELCGMIFEFEHPDFAQLVEKCRELTVKSEGRRINLSRNGSMIPLDWFQFPFIGNSGNFSGTDKAAFVQRHLDVFKEHAIADRDIFGRLVAASEPNFLSEMNLKKTFIDAGGVYEPAKYVYPRELFLIVALQLCQPMIVRALTTWRLRYSLCTRWTSFGGLVAALSSKSYGSLSYVSKVKTFGKGKVLSVAQEDLSE